MLLRRRDLCPVPVRVQGVGDCVAQVVLGLDEPIRAVVSSGPNMPVVVGHLGQAGVPVEQKGGNGLLRGRDPLALLPSTVQFVVRVGGAGQQFLCGGMARDLDDVRVLVVRGARLVAQGIRGQSAAVEPVIGPGGVVASGVGALGQVPVTVVGEYGGRGDAAGITDLLVEQVTFVELIGNGVPVGESDLGPILVRVVLELRHS